VNAIGILAGTPQADIADIAGTHQGTYSSAAGDDLLSVHGNATVGTVDQGAGDDTLQLSGGTIGGDITAGAGSDQLNWTNGTIAGAIDLGAGNDTATISDVISTSLAAPTQLGGGDGNDTLTLSHVAVAGVERLHDWETIKLTNGSLMTLDGNLLMGNGTATAAMNIDSSSRLLAGNGVHAAISAAGAGQSVSLFNGGTIDLTNGSSGATDTLTIVGNYAAASHPSCSTQCWRATTPHPIGW